MASDVATYQREGEVVVITVNNPPGHCTRISVRSKRTTKRLRRLSQ